MCSSSGLAILMCCTKRRHLIEVPACHPVGGGRPGIIRLTLQTCKLPASRAHRQACKHANYLQTCKLASLQTCKPANLQACKPASLQTCTLADSGRLPLRQTCTLMIANLQLLQPCTPGSLQTCKLHASLHTGKLANMQTTCNFANLQTCC
jgi:hypothetical protein